MSSPWRIGVLNEDNTVRSIYVHCDGAVQWGGKTLVENYTSIGKIARLIELGDLSTLGPEIGEKHDFDAHYIKGDLNSPSAKGWCKSYGRDRDEEDIKAIEHESEEAYIDYCIEDDAEQAYLFKGGEWWMIDFMVENPKRAWINATAALAKFELKQTIFGKGE